MIHIESVTTEGPIKLLGAAHRGDYGFEEFQNLVKFKVQPGHMFFSQAQYNGKLAVSTGRNTDITENENQDRNTYLESLGFGIALTIKYRGYDNGEFNIEDSGDDWKDVDFTKDLAAYKKEDGDIIIYTIIDKQDSTAKELANTLTEVPLIIDSKLYDLIYKNKLETSKQIQSGIQHLIEKNEAGDLIIANWEAEDEANRIKSVGGMIFLNNIEHNFLELKGKDYEEKGYLLERSEKRKYIIALRATWKYEGNEKKYSISPNIFEIPSLGSHTSRGGVFTRKLTTEEFEKYVTNEQARNNIAK